MGDLYFIGLGLHDVRGISIRGLEVVRGCHDVFAEFYTSMIPGSTRGEMEDLFGGPIRVLTREEVEGETVILEALERGDCALLTGGDPLSATTHQSLRLEALSRGHRCEIVHGASVFTSIPGLLGLQTYRFGRATTLARPQGKYFPTSPYQAIRDNLTLGLHSLVLLDIDVSEGYFMTADEGMRLLLRMEDEEGFGILPPDRMVCAVARAGSPEPLLWYGTLSDGSRMDFGAPLHTMVIPGDCHFMEQRMLENIGAGSADRK